VIGRLEDEKMLAAVGLGNTVINIIGVGMYYGLNGALSTFVSQAVGAEKYELSGVHLWRGRILLLISFSLLLVVFALSGRILKALG
jgi:Na+-driven multidrug efflux pump